MKKLLLLLALVLCTLGNAQVKTFVSNYAYCGASATVNLNSKSPEILANVTASDYSVAFYLTSTDAQANTNVITSPTNLVVTYQTKTIYYRVTNNQTNAVTTGYFDMVQSSLPTVTVNSPAPVCQGSMVTLTATPGSAGTYNYVWTVPETSNPGNVASIQTSIAGSYYVMIYDVITGCSANSDSVVVTQIYTPVITQPTPYVVCDDNNDGVSCLFDLHTKDPEISPAPGTVTSYYRTLADAQAVVNPISANPYCNINSAFSQILYVRVVDPAAAACASFTTLTLVVNNCNPSTCSAPTGLKASNITTNSATFSWTPTGNETSWQVSINPHGTSPSDVGIVANTNPFVVTGLEPDTCYSLYVRAGCNSTSSSEWAGPIDFCSVSCINNASCPGTMQLIAFVDTNDNEIKDTGEQNFDNGNFVYDINNLGTPIYGYSTGNFSIYESNPANSYNLSFALNPNLTSYFSSATIYSNITIPNGSNSTYYFPIKQLQSYNDLEIDLVPISSPRPGFNYYNYIYYKNKGTETIPSGTITFTNSPKVTITSISEGSAITTPTGFTYTFSNLAPNESRYLYVNMQIPTIPTVNLGDLITNSVTIEPLIGDAFPNDNSSSLTATVVGSYDPNEMIESHGRNIVFDDFTANDYLYYTIKFENTGTAAAEFIRVEDLLDASLDPSSIVMLNSDHTYNMRRIDNNLIWNFYNINLPPTMTSPNDSHGTIQFKIKPKAGYKVGDIIPNKADIFFDYNPAIVTNEFQTEFTAALSNSSFDKNAFSLYPNPTNTSVQISSQNNETIKNIVVYDVLGKTVKAISNLSTNQTTIDVSNLTKGVYMVEITSDADLKLIKKLIIE